jgi:tetratricopeptide (TPR) repeat protein
MATDAVEDIDLEHPAPWCEDAAREKCQQTALDLSARVERMAPETCAPHALHATARLASGDPAGGLDELARASDAIQDRVTCLKALALLARKAKNEERATDALNKIANAGCAQDHECADNLLWAAAVEEKSGNTRHALSLVGRASQRVPENDFPIQWAARLASSIGLHAEASDDYDRLARRHPGEAQWAAAAQSERAAAVATEVSF